VDFRASRWYMRMTQILGLAYEIQRPHRSQIFVRRQGQVLATFASCSSLVPLVIEA